MCVWENHSTDRVAVSGINEDLEMKSLCVWDYYVNIHMQA